MKFSGLNLPENPTRRLAGASSSRNSGPRYYILIHNLDENVSTSAMSRILLRHTEVSPTVYLCPTRSPVHFHTAVIATESRGDIQKILDFLLDRDHLIVSSKGRPWVVNEKVFNEPCSGILSQSQDVSQDMHEFQLVHSGTEAFYASSRARDLFLEMQHHMGRMYANLDVQQKDILKEFTSGRKL